MASSLSLTVFILWATAIATFIEAFPNEVSNEQAFPNEDLDEAFRDEDLNEVKGLDRRGWLWGSKKKSKPEASDIRRTFKVLSCPLDFLSKKKCDKRGLLPYGPYGLVHTFIKIGDTCYDWGNWNFARRLQCTDPKIDCCYEDSRTRYTGSTQCANRLDEFEDAWEDEGNGYGWWSWNCQRYTNAMKDFLNNCYSNADDAIP